jgi:hypothetical protein
MRRQQTMTMGTQTTATNPANLAIKMESLNLEAIEKKRETEVQAKILSGSLRQERLKEQLQVFEEQAPSIGYCHECG